MEQPMIEEIRELFQNFIAPQLESIRGEIKAIDARIGALDFKLEAKIETLDTKVESFRRELLSEIRRVEEVLSADFVRLEERVDLRLANMGTQLASSNAIMNARFEAMNDRLELYRPKSAPPRRASRR
jgi:hypothetical protein